MARRRWTWDGVRYRYPSGRVVPVSRERAVIARRVRDLEEDFGVFADRLADGHITPRQFQRVMAGRIKDVHVQARLLGVGGREAATFADYGAVGGRLRVEYARLGEFGQQVARGELSPAQIRARARMYARGSVRRQYEDGKAAVRRLAGFSQKRRVLGSDRPCSTCESEAGLGWVPISHPMALTETECRANDHCDFDYRRGSLVA